MTGAAWQVLMSHWWRHPVQLLALMGGLAMATALFAGVQAINAEARSAYAQASATINAARFGQFVAEDNQPIAVRTYVALRRAGGPLAPIREGLLERNSTLLRVIGLDPLNPPPGLVGSAATGGEVDLLTLIAGEVALANAETAQAVQGQPGLPRLVAMPQLQEGLIVMDLSRAEALLGPGLSRLVLTAPWPQAPPSVAQRAGLRLAKPAPAPDPAALTESFHLNLSAFGMLSFAVGMFIVQGVVNLAFAQRRADLAVLRLLGLPLWRLVALLAVEQIVYALLAGCVGILAGYGLAAILMPDIAATLSGLYGAEIGNGLRFRPEWWALALLLAVLGCLGASLSIFMQLPKTHALAGPPMGRLGQVRRMGQRSAVAGAVMLIFSLGLLGFGTGLVAAFALLAGLMAGAALLQPWLLERMAAWAQAWSSHPLWAWFWADMRLQLGGVSLALMALLLALATTIGVNTMVSSFRLTFVDFLDQRLTADLYVDQEGAAAERLTRQVTQAEAYPVLQTQTTLFGVPVGVSGTTQSPRAQAAWRFIDQAPDAWRLLSAGHGVLVSEQLARAHGLKVGDMVALRPDFVRPVLAVFADYGNPIGQIRLGEAAFRDLFPSTPVSGVQLFATDVAALRAELETLGVPQAWLSDQAAVKRASRAVFERTFAVTAALSGLTLIVAGFAMLMALTTMAEMRPPHLAPVWAMGVARARLSGLELARMMGLALMTALLSVPLGIAQAAVLLTRVNVEAFGWQLPLHFFPSDYGQVIGWALLTAMIAALWPALRLLRTPPARLVQVFAND